MSPINYITPYKVNTSNTMRDCISDFEETIYTLADCGAIRTADISKGVFFNKSTAQTILNRCLSKCEAILIRDCQYRLERRETLHYIETLVNTIPLQHQNASEDLGLQLTEISKRLESVAFQLLGIAYLQEDFFLQRCDFQTVNRDILDPHRDLTNCRDFAFYHLHLREAFKHIYHRVSWPDEESNQPQLDYLTDWGLRFVHNPQPGDLVVYGKIEGNDYENTHFGIINEQGRVTSKWGTYPIYDHPLEEVLYVYGDLIFILRKKYRFECQRKLISKVKRLSRALKSHSDCIIKPHHSLEKIKKYFIKYFEKELIRDSDTSLRESLFGRMAINLYGSHLVAKLRSIEVTCFRRQTELLSFIKLCAQEAADKQPTYINRLCHN